MLVYIIYVITHMLKRITARMKRNDKVEIYETSEDCTSLRAACSALGKDATIQMWALWARCPWTFMTFISFWIFRYREISTPQTLGFAATIPTPPAIPGARHGDQPKLLWPNPVESRKIAKSRTFMIFYAYQLMKYILSASICKPSNK